MRAYVIPNLMCNVLIRVLTLQRALSANVPLAEPLSGCWFLASAGERRCGLLSILTVFIATSCTYLRLVAASSGSTH